MDINVLDNTLRECINNIHRLQRIQHKTMPSLSLHEQYIAAYILHIIIRTIFQPAQSLEDMAQQLNVDISSITAIQQTRYLQARSPVAKSGSLHLAWEYAQSPSDHHRFINMLRVSPTVFQVILSLIEDHPIFYNESNNPQASVEVQLAITLYRMGRYGNGASVEDIAWIAGCSEGAVELYTKRCFTAIESLHDDYVHPPTDAEKEVEKCWMDQHLGFKGTWREGWVMYDGTIVVLHAKPGLNGDAYYTRKANYGLNLQVCFSLVGYFY